MREIQDGRAVLRSASITMRSRVDIMASILGEAGLFVEGSRKTRFMYRCNLSFRQLNVYLDLLCDKKFLKVIVLEMGNRRIVFYKITNEGRSFLKSYDDLSKRLNEKRLIF